MADTFGTINLDVLSGDEKIVAEAKGRFRRCEQWESDFRKAFLEDVRFSCADAYNMWQWPNDIRRNRDVDQRPVLTVNKTNVHCLQIINDSLQNPASVSIKPTGGGASYESAEILESIVRRIEYISNAQSAYAKAIEFQVRGGIGYWRIVTDYADNDSFDQEIFIRRIRDPLNVYIDPDINEIDGSDAKFAFVFDDMPREEFKKKYPEELQASGQAALGNWDPWQTKDTVRVAEYYRVVEKKSTLVAYTDPNTQVTSFKDKKEIPQPLRDMILADPTTKTRPVMQQTIEWYLIAGDSIIDKKDWPGKYIPIVRVVGSEMMVGGELDRKGHTRALIDPQRIYNYWTSAAVEQVALQNKMPYKAAAQAIEGYETYWETANTVNYSVLPYKHIDDDGNPIPPPTREQPPQMASAYIQGMQISANEMMMVSGQYQAVMGAQSNETSGKAINERQRQGENATYHFIANFAHGIRYTGKILIDLIPKIYDTPRVMRVMAEDGSSSEVQLDPAAKAAFMVQQNRLSNGVMRIFNPNLGKYEVEAEIGPSYGTRRQEAFNAFEMIAAQNPGLMSVIGDLMFKNADFPGADKIAERLERMVPAQALGAAAPPEIQQLQQQLQNSQKITSSLVEELAKAKMELKNKSVSEKVDEYDAVTSRLKALLPTMVNPADIAKATLDLMKEERLITLQSSPTNEPGRLDLSLHGLGRGR